MSAIWAADRGGAGRPLTQAGFPDEAALHDLVEKAPRMLPLAGSPRLTVLGREVRLGGGYADLLAVESSGRLVIIEVKLAGNAEARRAALDGALDEYEALGSTWTLPDTLIMVGTCRFVTGEWHDAVQGLEDGLRVAAEFGQSVLGAPANATVALIDLGRGDIGAAGQRIAPFGAELRSGAPRFGTEMVAYVAALIAEVQHDLPAAFTILRRTWEFAAAQRNRHSDRYLAPALVRVALELGETAVARAVANRAEQGAKLAPEVATVQAAAVRCRGLVDGDPSALLEAVEFARRGPRVLDLAVACEDAAMVLAGAGRADEAKALLIEAFERYEAIGAKAWAARVTAALRRLGVRRGVRGTRLRPVQGWESLTPTEVSVSRLVAEGLTNREVAQRLYMSPHTVNTHLRHVFGKLGIASRAGLASEAARNSSTTT